MANELVNAELVVISDVHLRTCDDSRGTLLLSLIRDFKAPGIKKLILLGDIFDFFFGRSPYFREKFAPMGEALSALARSGTEVYFFEGNHEFDLAAAKWDGVQFINEGSKILRIGKLGDVAFAHGDLVYSDWQYRAFRGLVKSRFVKFVANLIPARWLDAYALGHAKVSRASDHYRKVNTAALLKATDEWMQKQNVTHGVIGHFHTPFNVRTESGTRLLSLCSWDKPNVLAVTSEGQWVRGYVETTSGKLTFSDI